MSILIRSISSPYQMTETGDSETKSQHRSRLSISYRSVQRKKGYDCEHNRENAELKKLVITQRESINKMQEELSELLKRTSELSSENDELVNDMHGEVSENDELMKKLDASRKREKDLCHRFQLLEKDRDRLQEKYEDSLGRDLIGREVRKNGKEMKFKISEASKKRLDLEEQVQELRWQNDELNCTIETLVIEKNTVERTNEGLAEMVQELQDSVHRLFMEKYELQVKLEEKDGSRGQVHINGPDGSSIFPGKHGRSRLIDGLGNIIPSKAA